jgi:hypothetical protein
MDAEPRCPACRAVVRDDWDWCHACGYDPEQLRPAGWVSPDAEAEASSKRGRRSRRANKAAAKVPVAAAAPASAAPGAPASAPTLSISELVDPVLAPGLRPLAGSDELDEPAPAASPPPSSRWPSPLPELTLGDPRNGGPSASSASASSNGNVTVLRVPASQFERAGAILLIALAAGAGYLAVTAVLEVFTGASTSILDNVTTVMFILVCAVIAVALVAQALALLRQRIELSPTELVAYNRFGRVRRVPRDEIHTIRMGERQYATPKGLSSPLEAPYLQRSDGGGFWLDALGAKSPLTPRSDEQHQLYGELCDALESTGTRVS